ncbi:serine protease DegQ [Abditibacterium utsteinense]|uniref:Serine protease DegQ n=1 Tax=Abditibacterium utsteinense TaxID=1960156 RepID=A0A2S8SPB5_9BACT|nr:trypsin-like peptidase domain-containing protein [Abditibacterium utsteinense]PQV62642.1 serine protease DegQ [Abditibacterium utsteinense]
MKNRALFSLCGVSLATFLIGACVQNAATPQNGLQGSASAQSTAPRAKSNAPIRNADDLAALSSTYAQIARKVTPAVVNIQSTTIIPGRVLRDPFSDFFGDGGRMLRERDRKSQSLGSGVLIDARGLIITNNHVVKDATQIIVTLNDKRRFPAKVLGADPDSDVAVLKIDAANLPVLRWANSSQLNVGDIVLAVGSPFGLSSTVTQGIISAKGRRDLGISAYEDFLQTDAAINPGNSGGALVDVQGNLVGINTAILSESGGNQGIGLAIPSQLAQQVIGQLAKNGRVTRGWLGIVVEPLSGDNVEPENLNNGGVLVTGVLPQSPAARLPWIENGTNILLSVNGKRLDSAGELRNLVAGAAPGQDLKLRVWQNGQVHEFEIFSARRPAGVSGV